MQNIDYQELISSWANSKYFNKATRLEIQNLIKKKKKKDLDDRFYKKLEFGTGGFRALIGAGTNRINIYTIREIAFALAQYLKLTYKKNSVVIAFDSRRFSKKFAQESAKVLASNGIKVWIFRKLSPTPLLSFAVRELKTSAGIMITASHNPPQYNGYKIYGPDGAQLVSPSDKKIVAEMQKITSYDSIRPKSFKILLNTKKIEWCPATLQQKYINLLDSLCIGSKQNNENLNLLYSPLYGVGKVAMSKIMQKRNFKFFRLAKKHQDPDENFGELKSPNPEEKQTMNLVAKFAKAKDDLIIATDPDADRIGVMCRKKSQWILLNGNQIGQLLLYYYLQYLKNNNRLAKNGVFISTIVSSNLQLKIAQSFGLTTYETATGFKNIARIMKEIELTKKQKFIFAFEESNGYLFSDQLRDKDGIMAAAFFAEMSADLKANKKSVLDLLEEIYQRYGFYQNSLINYQFEGAVGAIKIDKIMQLFRKKIKGNFAGLKIINKTDYKDLNKQKVDSALINANILVFDFEKNNRLTVRPSGTEPKIKFYLNLSSKNLKGTKIIETDLKKAIDKLIKEVDSETGNSKSC